jgi:phasin family protein
MTADVKELAAVKSPADFFKLQGELLRRNFDAAVATGSKRSEAIVKLANDAFAPVQNRVSLAIDKVKQAA